MGVTQKIFVVRGECVELYLFNNLRSIMKSLWATTRTQGSSEPYACFEVLLGGNGNSKMK